MGVGRRCERRKDESVQYVLPLMHILKVVEEEPRDIDALRLLLEPMSAVVAERLPRLMTIVEECRGNEESGIV